MMALSPPPPVTAPPPVVDTGKYKISRGVQRRGKKVLIYGAGGVGKSTLASLAPNCVFVDIDNGGTAQLDVARVDVEPLYHRVREVLQDKAALSSFKTIAIDSITGLQELAVAFILSTIATEKGDRVTSIEGYGYGKGYRHIYDAMNRVLGDLEWHVNAGRNVVLIAHEVTRKQPNPQGDDFLAYAPAVMDQSQSSFLARLLAWCDEVLFVQSDRSVDKSGKAKGKGTRTIYADDSPAYKAKSRSGLDPMLFEVQNGAAIWNMIINGAAK